MDMSDDDNVIPVETSANVCPVDDDKVLTRPPVFGEADGDGGAKRVQVSRYF